ncbi:MAG: hypothetical protein NVSMB32_17490 [Actinomycetota bacterium]
MPLTTGLRSLTAERVEHLLDMGGLLVDLRPTNEFLEAHIRGSIPLLFEAGPGLGGRARDLLPLDARLVLLEDPTSPLDRAADSLRGKGFDVVGYFAGGVDAWPFPASGTPVISLSYTPLDMTLIDVADPGTVIPPTRQAHVRIPTERLWLDSANLERSADTGVLAGWGVRAAAAIGILEKLGLSNLTFVRTRASGERPASAGNRVFRAGGPA